MGASSDYPVYTGFWTNWSDGKVMGATLTLNRSDSNLLIAFVAFFLTIITTRLWAIISFIFHSSLSTSDPRGTLHHQRQILLRNNSGPAGTAWTLVQLAWQWRKHPRTIRRVLPLLVSTLLVSAGFAVAAGFSSRVARGSEVLLVPRGCGLYVPKQVNFDSQYRSWRSKVQTEAANYAQNCYSDRSPSSTSACTHSPYVQQELSMSVTTNASCPFDPILCATSSSNLVLDTGLIDSHKHLGINAPPDQRLQYRRLLQCAPLATAGYSESSDDYYMGNRSFTRYYYGLTGSGNYTGSKNYTHEYPSFIYANHLSETGDNNGDWWYFDYTLRYVYVYSHICAWPELLRSVKLVAWRTSLPPSD